MKSLPPPSADALEQSGRLTTRIIAAIRDAGGWIPLSRYMELALYAPQLGYYSSGTQKFGPAGDFITAPELTPLFGQALAVQVAQIMRASAPRIIEAGAGTGLLAADMLLELERSGCLPEYYGILDLSGDLRVRQRDTLNSRVPHLLSRVHWLDDLPERFCGAVIANEVLDAMPVHRIVSRADGLYERGVALDEAGALCWRDAPAPHAVACAAAALELPVPEQGEYVTELNLAAAAWVSEWAARLDRGVLLLIDYGYPRDEYYLPSRSNGTLQCYYRHRAHGEPLKWPGLCDITAFVDFTAIAEAGYDAGLDVLGYTNQAAFLINCGILEHLARRGPETGADYIRASRALQRLITPQEMGELFKVLALGRGGDDVLLGFAQGDRLHAL